MPRASGLASGNRATTNPASLFEVHLLIEPFEEESLVLICFIKVIFHFQTNNWDDIADQYLLVFRLLAVSIYTSSFQRSNFQFIGSILVIITICEHKGISWKKLTLESYRKSTYVKSFIHLSIVVEILFAFINGTTCCEINSDGWSPVFTSARLFLNRATNSTRENSSGLDCFSIYDGSVKLQNWLHHPDSHLFCANFLHSLPRVCKLAQYYWRT